MRERETPKADASERVNVENIERHADRRDSVKQTDDGARLAEQLGISQEELDRRIQAQDAKRDAADKPPLARSAVKDRAAIDDFGTPAKAKDAEEKAKAAEQVENAVAAEKAKDAAKDAASERRQREAQEALKKRYHEANAHYYAKDDPKRVAFSDKGNKLVTQEKDVNTAAAMAQLAEAKGWSTIKVSGKPEFAREVWIEAKTRGIQVKGYKPTEADLAALEIQRERRARNGIEHVPGKERAAPEMPKEEVKHVREAKQREEDYNQLRPDGRERIDKSSVVQAVASALSAEKIKSPAARQKVMTEVNRQLNQQSAKGKDVPTLHTYDKNAPAKAREVDHSRSQVERNTERTR